MADNTQAVQKLYIEYFQRPADPEGLKFWVDALNGNSNPNLLAQIEHDFATSAEYNATYSGMSNREMIQKVYNNVFGRTADTEGLNFWTNALDTHSISVETMVREIVKGAQTAQNEDAIVFNGRVAVATEFTTHIDTQAEIDAYLKPNGFKIASDYVGDVVDLGSAARAMQPSLIDDAIAQIVGTPTATAEVAHIA